MKRVLLLWGLLSVFSIGAFAQRNVTFQVDMGLLPVSTVYIVGGFNNWDLFGAGNNGLTLVGGTVYQITLAMPANPAGTPMEYKFVNGANWANQEGITGACKFGTTNNRWFSYPNADTTLGLVCFNQCTTCVAANVNVNVNFMVDMTGTNVSPNGVQIIGDFQGWNPSSDIMSRIGTGNVYGYSRTFTSGQYIQWKTLNGNDWGAGIQEVVIGGCTAGTNRTLLVPDRDTTITYRWEYCTADGVIPGTKVGMIGNSIAYGANVPFQGVNSIARKLGRLMPNLTVDNFGHSGATMLKAGDTPYWKTPEMTNAYKLNPDMLIIELGSNDSKPYMWSTLSGGFRADYENMIDTFRVQNPAVDVYAFSPTKAYTSAYAISEANLANDIRPGIIASAKVKGANVIDGYDTSTSAAVTGGSGYTWYFEDGIHPTLNGNDLLAAKMAHVLSTTKPVISQDGPVLTASYGTEFTWYLNGNVIPGATTANYTAVQTGKYRVLVKLSDSNEDRLISPVLDVTSLVGVSNKLLNAQTVVYPNPASSEANVKYTSVNNGSLNMEVYDMRGVRVHTQSAACIAGVNSLPLNISTMAPGIYTLRTIQSGKVTVTRFSVK
ncbi:MAG: GDSL-type esterase/lipase family protein [Bacteroidota bacterium]